MHRDRHRPADPARLRRVILASSALTLALYVLPFGRLLAWPLLLGASFAHELGHGLAAAALGGQFISLQIFADGSGVARHGGAGNGLATGLVAMGGLVGPAFVGALLLTLARWPRIVRGVWLVMGLSTIALALTVLRGATTFGFAALVVAVSAWMVRRASPDLARGGLVFVAIQLALSVLSNADYLFTDTATTGAGTMPSDVAVMASALGGPYWVWGMVCGLTSVTVATVATVAAWRRPRDRTARPATRRTTPRSTHRSTHRG